MKTTYVLGIDVSQETLNTALTLDGRNFHESELQNNYQGILSFFKQLKRQLTAFTNLIVCIEHTGIYCLPLLDFLVEHKINVCVEHALQIKQSQGMTRGKNDRVDAVRISSYAFKNMENITLWKPQRESIQKLKALLTLRDRLIKVKNQLETPLLEYEGFVNPAIRKSITKQCNNSLKALKKDLRNMEITIGKIVQGDQIMLE